MAAKISENVTTLEEEEGVFVQPWKICKYKMNETIYRVG